MANSNLETKTQSTASPAKPTLAWPTDRNRSVKDFAAPGDCPACGGSGYFRQDLAADHPDFGKLVPCQCALHRQHQVRRKRSQFEGWLLEATFQNYALTEFSQAAYQASYDFARQRTGWLTLCGNNGTAKTHLLAAIVNYCDSHQVKADYFVLADLLDLLRASYGDGDYSPLFEYLQELPVLVVDELNKANLNDWALEKIYQLADARYRQVGELGTVFALNPDPRAALDDGKAGPLAYLFSRMCDQRANIVRLDGPDARPVSQRLWASHSDPDAEPEPEPA